MPKADFRNQKKKRYSTNLDRFQTATIFNETNLRGVSK